MRSQGIQKMKGIKIQIAIDEATGKIVTTREFVGYDTKNIHHQLEILGIMDNLIDLQKDKIKTLEKREV